MDLMYSLHTHRAPVPFACFARASWCPHTPSTRCPYVPCTFRMYSAEPACSCRLPRTHTSLLLYTLTLPACSWQVLTSHTTQVQLKCSPTPVCSLHASQPFLPLACPCHNAMPAVPPGQCGCVWAESGGPHRSPCPRDGPSACQALRLHPHTAGELGTVRRGCAVRDKACPDPTPCLLSLPPRFALT